MTYTMEAEIPEEARDMIVKEIQRRIGHHRGALLSARTGRDSAIIGARISELHSLAGLLQEVIFVKKGA